MKKLFIIISALSCLFHATMQANNFYIIPEPVSIEYLDGVFNLKKNMNILASKEIYKEAQFLQEFLKNELFINSYINNKKRADIILKLKHNDNIEKPEQYKINISSKGIEVTGNSNHGIFNGIQTLKQILRANRKKVICTKITDYPRFSWRAFMLDEARYFKGKEVVFGMLDRMAELKMNVFHWHLTDHQGWRIEIKKYPLLTEIGSKRDSSMIGHFGSNVYDGKPHSGFYTQNEITEVIEYARDRHILVIPEIDMPGHSTAAIASYPWLGSGKEKVKVACRFGPHLEAYNVTKPKVRQFLKNVLTEVIALFPSPIIHIGGDEVRYNYWNESESIQKYMKDNGFKSPADVQIAFTNEMSEWLNERNHRMMGWNEITGDQFHEYQSTVSTTSQKLAPNTIVHFWKGDPELMTKTVKKGYDVVNSYHKYTDLDYSYEETPLSKSYSFEPVPESLTEYERKHVLGLGCQMWCEFVPNVKTLNVKVFPRIAAIAEVGWTQKENKSYDRFVKSLEAMDAYWKSIGVIGNNKR